MKFAQMVCATSQNIGDDFQSIAAASRLPKVDLYVDREQLNAVEGPDPTCTIMNAWFMHGRHWPPSDFLRPIFVGFHVSPRSQELIARHAQYLKRYEPIGTRDKGTAEFLKSIGIKAEVTYCLTLTYPTRTRAPTNGKVLIVDANAIDIPRTLRRRAVRLANNFFFPGVRDATKLQYAQELIDYYRDSATLVITTRLHCALPCFAMGIPVIFFGDPADYRTRIVSDIGGTIYNRRLHGRDLIGRTIGRMHDRVDWSPKLLDISPIKEQLLQAVSTRMDAMKST
jgi:polysaccharide pyruvyl transferase